MAFVVIEDESLGPVDVGLLGAVGIVLKTDCFAHLVEQLLWSLRHANLLDLGLLKERSCDTMRVNRLGKESPWETLYRESLEYARHGRFYRHILYSHLV